MRVRRIRNAAARPCYSPPMTNLRQCDECGAPVEEQDDGSAQCSACMMTYPGGSMGDDTMIEEGLSLSEVMRIVREAKR